MQQIFLKSITVYCEVLCNGTSLTSFGQIFANKRPRDGISMQSGHELPEKIADSDDLEHFITRINKLLREEHDEEYCGIVYADDFSHPTLVKIFDPHNLGTSCGSSKTAPLPGWVISRSKPTRWDRILSCQATENAGGVCSGTNKV